MTEQTERPKLFWWIITAFLVIPLLVSVISTIHVITFFELSNYKSMAITLAIAFELGALAALAGLVTLDKINKNVVWTIFVILSIYQMGGNTYFAYDMLSNKMLIDPNLIKNWTELFGLGDEDIVIVKRIIAVFSGAILPIVSLCFLDLSVDYIRKSTPGMLPEPVKEIEQKEEEKILEPEPIEENQETPVVIESKAVIEHEPEIAENHHENFEKIVEGKKKKIDEMREPYLELLDIFYKNGSVNIGNELPSYNEFIQNEETKKFPLKEIKMFLTLCNYLEIFSVSGTQKTALKNYEEAKETLSSYLSYGEK